MSSTMHAVAASVAAFLVVAPYGAADAQTTGGAMVGTAPGVATAATAVSSSATVTAIDMATRQVTLRRGDGSTFTVVAGPEVRNLPQLRVGDTVTVTYYDTLTLELKKGGTGGPARRAETSAASRADPGMRPGAAAQRQVTIVADVVALDPAKQTVSLRGPQGNVVVLPVRDPEQFKLVAVGDQVEATYVEAAAISVTPVAAPAAPAAMAAPAKRWHYRASLYAWLPDIGGTTRFPLDGDGPTIDVDLGSIFGDLKFAFMGNFEATNGRWGVFTDLAYVDVGDRVERSRDFTIGNGSIPVSTTANLDVDARGWAWTIAGTYRVVDAPSATMDVLAGARMLDIKVSTNWEFNGSIGTLPPATVRGSASAGSTNWDAIIGVKGRVTFGADRRWFVPYYVDVGTGDSDLTWQAAGGLGYAFSWGDVIGLWRYLDYDMKSGKAIQSLDLNGPMIGLVFHW